MAVLYTKQGAVKLSKMLMKSTLRPHRLPQQTRIGRRTAQTYNETAFPVDDKRENGQQ